MAVIWTLEMDRFLRAHFTEMTKREMADKLGVSFNSVSTRLKALELTRKDDIRIGGKYFKKEEVDIILKRSVKESISKLARELGIRASSLWMYVRRRQVPSVIAYEKRQREERLKRSAARKRIADENRKKVISETIKPLPHRLREGSFYWVPLEQNIGAYKVKETDSPFDVRMFEKGWYFATEKDAALFSNLIQRKKNDDKDYEEMLKN